MSAVGATEKSGGSAGFSLARVTAAIKNLLNCEAHNEVVQTLARVRFEERVDEASSLIPDIEALQEMQIPASLL